MHRKYLLFLPLLFIMSCQHPKESLIIESFENLRVIPSASGVEVVDHNIWMVGDDSPFLYQFDMDLNLIQKYQISFADSTVNNRVVKSEKADFESLARKGDSLFILGSGSVKFSRDTLVIFSLAKNEVINKINMRSLYEKYKTFSQIEFEVNVEGLAISNKRVYFFNRGNIADQNDILSMSFNQFDAFLGFESNMDATTHRFQLPGISDFLSGFSGACLSKDGRYLYFTSSVEATRDVYNDGEVLGSFIGRIQLESQELEYWPLKENGEFLKTKLESISIIENTEEFIRFVCTSDNDDGSSGIYRIKLNLKPDSYE